MRIKFVGFLLVFVFSGSSAFSQPGWWKQMKQIKLLSDSYEDVVRLLGKPVDHGRGKDIMEYFNFEEGRMWVQFEPGNCGDGMIKPGWNVPNGPWFK